MIKLSNFRLCFGALLAIPLIAGVVRAEPVGLIERFALAEDRQAVLDELIPGSEDYYFFHCLHYQTTGQLERAETILSDWLKEHDGHETPLIRDMLDRQRLLTYGQTPERTIDHLIRRLEVELDHSPPASADERRFPSSLDASLLQPERLVSEALRRNEPLKPSGIRYLAERLRNGQATGLPIDLREMLERVTAPYVDGLDELVIRELQSRRAQDRRFGDLAAHQQLTLEELQRVAERVPEVAADDALVSAILRRLRPDADSDPGQQPEVRLAYLKRVESYVRTLPPSYNSLKASATYRLLQANVSHGDYDRQLFLRYLQLPRVSPIVPAEWTRRSANPAQLNQDFMEMALLPPIGDERALVRRYLEHFLADAASTEAFQPYVQPDFLRQVFAETKLLTGAPDRQRWYEMLSPAQRQSLRDAVELRLAPQNPVRFGGDEPVELLVDLKKIDELIVRIYEINSESYYRTHDERLDTDIDLDGLVATHEKTKTYHQDDVVRHREKLELPEISGRGVWVVDLVGGGVRARALVRRGQLDHVGSTSADGMVFTIIDENRQPVPGATMWVGSRELKADDQGRIVLPPVSDATQRRAIISDGELAEPIRFEHLREQYALSASMQLDQTQLQSGEMTEVIVRPRLRLGSTPIAPQTLSDVQVVVTATDLDEVQTTKTVDDVQLSQAGELTVPLRVPPRLASLKVTLSGVIEGLADGKEQSLSVSKSWDIATLRRHHQTHDVFLTRDGEDFVLEVRGRNGEAIKHAAVKVSLQTEYRSSAVEQTLQADRSGMIRLSALPGVTSIRFGIPQGIQHHRDLRLDRATWPREIHTITGQPVELPLPEDAAAPADQRYRLVEVRGNAVHRDVTGNLAAEGGLLVIRPLDAGDYRLIDRSSGGATPLAVVDGPVIEQVATGKVRHQQMSPARPLGIESVATDEDQWKIQLSGNTELARVHVLAVRYLGPTPPIAALDLPALPLSQRHVRLPESSYLSELQLGDEYRYVLRRRYAAKYPGVMLPQPSLLLNPWQTEETTSTTQRAREGEPPPASAGADRAGAPMAEGEADRGAEQQLSSDHDFLADAGVLLANLRPDADGVVTIAAEKIGGMPLVQIVVSDPVTLVQRTVARPLPEIQTRDLRLAEALDAETPLSFERTVSIASPDQPLDLERLGSAQLQVFASVGQLLGLYKTLVGDDRLSAFDPLGRWHELDDAAKRKTYSELASHELHLFLWAHDRPFFDEVVRPYLKHKKEKQFVDHWLLGSDLEPYRALWRYNQLNAAEKALLAMRDPEMRPAVVRELSETVEEQDENHARLRQILESALAGERLEEEMSRGVALGIGGFAGQRESGRYADEAENEAMFGFMMGDMAAPAAKDARTNQRKLTEELDLAAPGLARGDWRMLSRRRQQQGQLPFYRQLDSTKQWAESQWDRVRSVGGPAPGTLIPIDPFWAELARADEDQLPLSEELLRPVENRHAALAALALCRLPLQAGDVELPSGADQPYRPGHPVAVVTKRLKRLETVDDAPSVLLGQRFEEAGQTKPESDEPPSALSEFLTGVAYTGQTVVSNPTGQKRTVDVFWQIPAGSLPLAGSQATDSKTIELEPFAVQAIAYHFYFPRAGEFTHYPATASREGQLLARGVEKTFQVVDQPSEPEGESWEGIARRGSPQQIAEFLKEANLRALDWSLVAHRMSDAEVYRVVTEVLNEAQLPIAELWAYGLKHHDPQAISTYLNLRSDLVQRVGPVLDSPLLEVRPIERGYHEHLEYAPLVRGRVHRLGDDHEILNPTFLAHYREFVRVLGFSAEPTGTQRLALTYYLLLQNRIEEAIEVFEQVERSSVATQLQFDYLDGYLAMHRQDYQYAGKIAEEHRQHPVPRWRERFDQLAEQLNQRRHLMRTEQLASDGGRSTKQAVAEDAGDLAVIDRQRRQERAAEAQPEVIVRVEGDSLRIDHRNVSEVTLNLYGVDLELLFSKAPFVREDLQRMAMVRPTHRKQISLDNATGVARYPLEEDLSRQTLLVEVTAGASRSTALYYGGQLTTYVSESYGQLQTSDAATHQPVSAAYVKVYGKYPDGSVKFYKDGYTDARGRFDYVSLSAEDARGATRFAILVLDPERGATLHEVAAPTR